MIHIRKPNLKDQTSMEDQLLIQLGNVEIPIFVVTASGISRRDLYGSHLVRAKALWHLSPVIRQTIFMVQQIDIGTTTVVTSLIDMMTGKEMGTASRINAQKEFGLDVLTRISYETEHPEDGKEHLQKVITDSINEMLR